MAKTITLEFSDEDYENIVAVATPNVPDGNIAKWAAYFVLREANRPLRYAEHLIRMREVWNHVAQELRWHRMLPGDKWEKMAEVIEQLRDPETPDRSVAMIGGAMIEYALETSIRLELMHYDYDVIDKLFSPPLGVLLNVSARTDIARALHLFGPVTHRDIGLLCKVRNRFAHRLTTAGFGDDDIASMCGELEIPRLSQGAKYQPKDARRNFVHAVGMIDVCLAFDSLTDYQRIQFKPFLP